MADFPALTETVDFIEQLPQKWSQRAIPRHTSRRPTDVHPAVLFKCVEGWEFEHLATRADKGISDRGKTDLLRRLSDEFGQIARPFNEGTSSDWRTALIPLLRGPYLENFQMSFRRGRRW